ncbi:hypothetical protein evm_009508 [Chilo suppressalis]|nr:hypothetical protein evm_009508 [Chilo suppressalis]
MCWKQISLVWLALTAASAYRQIHPYSGFYSYRGYQQPPQLSRRIEVRNAEGYGYGRSDRVASERSIPFSNSAQRVQAQEWTRFNNDAAESRNGNISLKIGSRTGSLVDSESVVFPGPTSRRASFEPEIPAECEGKTICETVHNYPQEYIDEMLSKMTGENNMFNLDVETPEISQRRGSWENSIELCEHTETIIYPKAAKTTQGKWVLVVNKDNEPVQGFKAEMCTKPNDVCSEILSFPSSYNSTCHQKMTERSMWSLDRNGQMIKESILTPSCCTCLLVIVSPNDRYKRAP